MQAAQMHDVCAVHLPELAALMLWSGAAALRGGPLFFAREKDTYRKQTAASQARSGQHTEGMQTRSGT